MDLSEILFSLSNGRLTQDEAEQLIHNLRVPRKTTQISHQVTVDIANQPMPAGNRLFFTRLERFFFSLKAISIRPSGALCLLTGKSRGHAAGFQAT